MLVFTKCGLQAVLKNLKVSAYKLNWRPNGRKLVSWAKGLIEGISRQPMTTIDL